MASPNPPLSFTSAAAISAFNSPASEFFAKYSHINHIITGILVFRLQPSTISASNPPTLQTLLLRRAPTDSYPLHWETPGGTADESDASVIATAARELWEETTLRARHFSSAVLLSPLMPLSDDMKATFSISADSREGQDMLDADGLGISFEDSGQRWCKFSVIAEVEDTSNVVTRDDEHDKWAWATEDEVINAKFTDDSTLGFVSYGVMRIVIEGFRIKKEELQNKGIEFV